MSDPLRFLTDEREKRLAEEALQRVKTLVHAVAVSKDQPREINWLPWHVIELLGEKPADASSAEYRHVSASSAVGIGAHVDHPHQSGRVIAALSLLHPAVIRFRKAKAANLAEYVDVLATPGSVYIQKFALCFSYVFEGGPDKVPPRDVLRYHYTHEIPISPSEHVFQGRTIPKQNRISIMLRDVPTER